MAGIQIIGIKDNGYLLIESFGIIPGEDEQAADALIDLISGGAEVTLMNDLDEGGEGSTSIRAVEGRFQTKTGGHGWQGHWGFLGETEVREQILELAPLNRGGHWSTRGSITRQKG